MSINYAILGILSYKSLSGYDLKKIIQESPFMHWSGNNNQIYKALVELLDEGFVTNEVYHQESSPSKKIYTITKEGLEALKEWVLSSPEPLEPKKPFLVQLAWSGQLNTDEFHTLLSGYENELRMQLLMQKEKKQRKNFSPDRTPKETYLWDMIYDNIILSYENELSWLQRIREELSIDNKESNRMNFTVIEKDDKKYLEFISADTPLLSEKEVLDIISLCYEYNTSNIMLHAEMLDDDFFRLRTGLAGQILQKFANYRVRVAAILSKEQKISGKFKELITESNRGNDFRVFNGKEEAENWLLCLN